MVKNSLLWRSGLCRRSSKSQDAPWPSWSLEVHLAGDPRWSFFEGVFFGDRRSSPSLLRKSAQRWDRWILFKEAILTRGSGEGGGILCPPTSPLLWAGSLAPDPRRTPFFPQGKSFSLRKGCLGALQPSTYVSPPPRGGFAPPDRDPRRKSRSGPSLIGHIPCIAPSP